MKSHLPPFLLILLFGVALLRADLAPPPDLATEFAQLDAWAVEHILEEAPEAASDPWALCPAPIFLRAQWMRVGDAQARQPYPDSVFGERYRQLQRQTKTEGLCPALRAAWHAWFGDWRAAIRRP